MPLTWGPDWAEEKGDKGTVLLSLFFCYNRPDSIRTYNTILSFKELAEMVRKMPDREKDES